MTVKKFIEQYSHNNEIVLENKNHVAIYPVFKDNDPKLQNPETITYNDCKMMDWEVEYTELANKKVLAIKSVVDTNAITIVIDTVVLTNFIIKKKVKRNNCPVWLYELVHNVKLITVGVEKA